MQQQLQKTQSIQRMQQQTLNTNTKSLATMLENTTNSKQKNRREGEANELDQNSGARMVSAAQNSEDENRELPQMVPQMGSEDQSAVPPQHFDG